MRVFYITLFLTYILSLMSRLDVKKKGFSKPNIVITVAIISLLVAVAGLRNGIGDTGDYKHLYTLIVDGQEIDPDAYEPGFIFLLKMLTYISPDPQIMVFVTALITTAINIWILRKYSSLFELQTYMYITAGYFLVTMNGIRQALAAAIIFAGTKFIIEGKFIPYLFICLFASTMHSSAIIMIPMYFIVREKPWSKKILFLIGISMVALIFMEPLLQGIFEASEGTKIGGYEDAVMGGSEGGTNILRVIIAAVPAVLAYLGRGKLEDVDKEMQIFINMSLINMLFMGFALYTWLFARFNLYFQLYTFILLPYLIKHLFEKNEKRLVYYSFLICYFVFFYYEHVIALGMNYTSNYIHF